MTARVIDLQYMAHAVPDLAAERKFYAGTIGPEDVTKIDENNIIFGSNNNVL